MTDFYPDDGEQLTPEEYARLDAARAEGAHDFDIDAFRAACDTKYADDIIQAAIDAWNASAEGDAS